MINSEDLSPSDRLKLEGSYSELKDTPYGVAQASSFKQLGTSFTRGLDEALISGQLPNVLARNKARSLDEASGLKPLTEDEFNNRGFNRYGSAFKRDADETPSQTQLRFDLFLKRMYSQEVTSSGGGAMQTVANFGAEFAGGLTGDLPIAVVPYAGVAARIGTAGKALRVGWKQASAQAAMNQSTRAAAYETALASGSKLKVAGLVLKDHFKESLIASTVETGIWGASEQYVSGDVTMKDMAINGGFSLGMSTPFSAFGIKRAWKEQGKIVKYNQDVDTVLGFLENGETTQAAFKLADFYEPAKKIARENEEFAFLLQDVDDISQLSPEQLDAANRFQQMVTINELKKGIAQHLLNVVASDASSKVSQEDLQRDIADQTGRIYNAIDNNTYLTLSEEDWNVMVLSGWDPTASDLKLRNQYLDSIDYKNMEFRPVLSEENSQTAELAINEYDGPELAVDMDYSLKTLGSANPETGQIRINPQRVTADWEAGMPHLIGQGKSASSEQKKIVFKDIDIDKLKAALGDEQGYLRFILAHEAAHTILNHKKIRRKDWLSDEAVNQEIAANEYAAKVLGIDWASLTKTPQMEFTFTPETKQSTISVENKVKSTLEQESKTRSEAKFNEAEVADQVEDEVADMFNPEFFVEAQEAAKNDSGVFLISESSQGDGYTLYYSKKTKKYYLTSDSEGEIYTQATLDGNKKAGLEAVKDFKEQAYKGKPLSKKEVEPELKKRVTDEYRERRSYKAPSKEKFDALVASETRSVITALENYSYYKRLNKLRGSDIFSDFVLEEAETLLKKYDITSRETDPNIKRITSGELKSDGKFNGVSEAYAYITDETMKDAGGRAKPDAFVAIDAITPTEVYVRLSETKEGFRRKGLNTKLINHLREKYPDKKIVRFMVASEAILEAAKKVKGAQFTDGTPLSSHKKGAPIKDIEYPPLGVVNKSNQVNPLAPSVTSENFIDVKNRITDTFLNDSVTDPKPPQQAELVFEAETILENNLEESVDLNNDRAGFFVNRTNEVLGNPNVLGLILSTPEGYNAANDKGAVARKAHVRTVLEQNGLENYSDIAETVVDIAARKDFQESLINDIFDEAQINLDVKGLSEELKTSIRIILSESDDMFTAKARVLQSLNETVNAETLRVVLNGKIQNDFIAGANQFKNPKQRIEWIQSQLDGQQRSGFNPESSANVKSKAQIVVDAKPINDVLEKHGLWDVFIGAGHGPYLEVLRKQTGGNPDAIKIYGKDLRANVNAFAADLMVAMRTGETPAKWKGSEAFEELIDAIKRVRDSQLVALNRFGSNVRVLDNFSGWSQRWSNATIKKIGFDQFRKDMLAGIDWDATSRAHGEVLTRENGKDVPFDRETYLKEWYYRITELKETLEGGDVARSFEQSRMVHLKADSEAKLLAKYSGEGNLGKLLMDQIRYRSEMIASLGFFGSDPTATIQKTLDAADLRRGDNVGKFKYDTVLGTTKLLINELDNPVDASFASIFKNVRKVGNLAFLPLSGFSALMDIPLSVSTLKYTGAEIGVNEFMPQFIEAMSRQFKGDKSGMTAYFRDVGAAYDVVNNANVRQITGDVSGEKGLLDLAMSFMFEANGMLRITAAGQEAFADWTSRSLGKDAASGKFNDVRLESLRNFGFTDAEIKVLLKSASKEAPDGISRVMPQTVEDANVSNKLREYYLHYMKQAILEPDAGAQAITRGNFKSGTVGGEVMRTGFQYTSFILGLSRVIFNRFANGYTGSQLNHVRAMSHLVAFVGTSLATAWFVTAMKDLSKGRAPINPMNMSSFDWQRIVSQSGLVGIGEIPLELLEGSLPVSPIAKAPVDLAAGVLGRDGKKVAKSVAPFVGGSYPVVGGPIKAMLGMAFTESAGSIVEAEFEYLQKF